ncbi:hypothetical protein QCA50_018396 [Cerrena zonata]|uniref:Uncharacterized protein n=1 Tax=Cerrena zonata TaxID=2478898 RepID=A0AAW0FG73_9APHY
MSVSKNTLLIGGLNVNVYSLPSTFRPISVLFLLHGRTRSSADNEGVAEQLLKEISEKDRASSSNLDLLVVTFDHRNHGSREVNSLANIGWNEFGLNNDRHAVDMYSIQVGSAQDVSFLIDFLPAFLYPNGEMSIQQWSVSGVSLGGHSAWITLRNDPRVKVGIPIIGGADYLALMSKRAETSGIQLKPPYLPESLRQVIEANDPVHAPYESSDSSNPFYGKKILALSGAEDLLVPFAATEPFFEKLNVGPNGVKKVILEAGVGHKCTTEMVHQMAEFIWKEVIAAPSHSAPNSSL